MENQHLNHPIHPSAWHALVVIQQTAVHAALSQLFQKLGYQNVKIVSDAVTAKALLLEQPFALLVVDTMMAQEGGEALLDFACQHTPATIRALLSEVGDEQSLLAITHSTQLLLELPLQASQLTDVWQRISRLQQMPFSQHTRYQLGKVNTLPLLPRHYQTLLTLLADEQSSTAALAASIAREAPLAAKLIQLANSAYLGFQRTTGDLNEVIVRLGRQRIRAVIFAVQLHHQYAARIRTDLHQQLLDNSYELAMMASQLAKSQQAGGELVEKAFLAGLMQVLGPLVLLAEQPLPLQQMTAEDMWQEGIPDHCVMSSYLLVLWGFEQDVCETVLYRLSLQQLSMPTLLHTILHLSSYVLIYRRQQQDQSPELCWSALEQFNLTDAFQRLQQD